LQGGQYKTWLQEASIMQTTPTNPQDIGPGSPPVLTPFPSRNYFMIALYWFAISFLWGGFLSVVLPVLNEPLATPIFGPNNIETARGIMTGLGLIIAMFVQPLAGAISDRSAHPMGRRRPFMIFGTLGIFAALVIIGTAGSWWILLAGYIMLQLLDNIAQGAYQGLMPDVVPEDRRGKASAALAISQLTGTLAGAVIPGILQGVFGKVAGSQIDLVLVGIVFSITLSLTVLFVKEKPYQPTEKISAFTAGINMFKGVSHYPDFVMLMLARFLFLTAPATASLFFKPFLEGTSDPNNPKFGLSFIRPTVQGSTGQLEVNAGISLSIILGIVILTATLAAYPFSVLSEKTGRKRMIFLATAIGFVGGVGLLVPGFMLNSAVDVARGLNGFEAQQNYLDPIRSNALLLVIFFGALIGSSWGAFMSVDWAYATDLIPADEAGRFMGLSNLATAGCQAFGAFVGGFVADSFLGYNGLFVLIGIYYILSACLLTRVRETRGRARQHVPVAVG
jgi:MFS family permease